MATVSATLPVIRGAGPIRWHHPPTDVPVEVSVVEHVICVPLGGRAAAGD